MDGVTRYDYAVFRDDVFVTNAMLTEADVAEMERDGYRCLRVRDTVGEGLPAFRGRRNVARSGRRTGRWGTRQTY